MTVGADWAKLERTGMCFIRVSPPFSAICYARHVSGAANFMCSSAPAFSATSAMPPGLGPKDSVPDIAYKFDVEMWQYLLLEQLEARPGKVRGKATRQRAKAQFAILS